MSAGSSCKPNLPKSIPRNAQEEQDCGEWLNHLSLRETGQLRSFIYSWTFFIHLKVTISWVYSRVIVVIFKMKKTVTQGMDTSLYKLYKFLQPHRVGFLRCFGLKTGIRFAHFTGRKNGFTNVCERCKYVVNLEPQICITFSLSANTMNYNVMKIP